MNRTLFGFVRNVNFLLDRNLLMARIPMPVNGTWEIATTTRCPISGDMLVAFRPTDPPESPNPLLEAEPAKSSRLKSGVLSGKMVI